MSLFTHRIFPKTGSAGNQPAGHVALETALPPA